MIKNYLDKIAELYTKLKTDENLDENTIIETYNELADLASKVTLEASEAMNKRVEKVLEDQLTSAMEKAQAESDLIANAPMPDIVLPTAEGMPDVVVNVDVKDEFLSESRDLINYNKESDLPKLYPNTLRLLARVKPEDRDTFQLFADEFIDIDTTMAQRLSAMDTLPGILDASSPILKLAEAYLSEKSTRKAMRAMGKAATAILEG